MPGEGETIENIITSRVPLGPEGSWAVGGGGCESPGGRWPGCGRDAAERKQSDVVIHTIY